MAYVKPKPLPFVYGELDVVAGRPVTRPRLTDPEFRYVPAAKTDIKRTFARVRAALKKEGEDGR